MSDDREDIRDELPAELDVTAAVGPYRFPDNSRRRIPGYLYLGFAALLLIVWLVRRGDDPVYVNSGFVLAAVILVALAIYTITSGWTMRVDEHEALLIATRTVGFPVGHASAQMAWRGLRSRPTWRVLLYSGDEPPSRRGFVMLDAIDGEVLTHFTEDNPIEESGTLS